MTFQIYHNPGCSKSRQTLALLNENEIETTVINYLETPPDKDELKKIISLLGMKARELLRTGEHEYKLAGLDDSAKTEEQIIDAMLLYPILIERPIVVKDGQAAVIGRPPEAVLELTRK
ncbi:MAG: arsenate reductase (glutaredoxin) [Gammaproteobacteria bacterium]|nr:arsenate reductase (glutaredoxin) [Gammaproteobacteria bacterium]